MKEEKKGKFKKVQISTTANGYSLYFQDYVGGFNSRDWFIAKTLDEAKKLCAENLLEPKNY